MDSRDKLKLMDSIIAQVYTCPSIQITTLAKNNNIHPSTIWTWRRTNYQGFEDKWQEALNNRFAELEGAAISCISDLIADGNFQAAKYVLDNRGYKAEEKIKADVNQAIDICVSIDE